MSTMTDLTTTLAQLRTQAEALAAEVSVLEKAQAELVTTKEQLASTKTQLAAATDRVNQLLARIAELESQVPQPKTVFSWDVSSLGSDANLTEATKINGHKTMFGVDNIQNVRDFQSTSAINWNSARIQVLTDKDSVLVSFKTWNRAAFKTALAATPARLRQRKGQVKFCFHHEFEAEWASATDRGAWLAAYLKAYAEMAAELDASPWDTQSKDDVVKIFLWYSQLIDTRTKGLWQQFIGGQNFGLIGMDCYNYQAWLSKGRYATPQELFDTLIAMGKATGLPICAPEWGGELAAGDTGAGLAKAIADQGAYAKANGLQFVNWWCAAGSIDAATGKPRNHHVDNVPEAKAALTALIKG